MALKDPQNYVLKPQREGGGIAGGIAIATTHYTVYKCICIIKNACNDPFLLVSSFSLVVLMLHVKNILTTNLSNTFIVHKVLLFHSI